MSYGPRYKWGKANITNCINFKFILIAIHLMMWTLIYWLIFTLPVLFLRYKKKPRLFFNLWSVYDQKYHILNFKANLIGNLLTTLILFNSTLLVRSLPKILQILLFCNKSKTDSLKTDSLTNKENVYFRIFFG